MAITGGCLCKALRYSFPSDPIWARACWCRVCQYIGGGSGTVNAAFALDGMTVQGNLSAYENVADSGNAMKRSFCPKCGTPVFTESSGRPGTITIRVGTLDDPNVVKPATTIWTKMAQQWACVDETLPRFDAAPT